MFVKRSGSRCERRVLAGGRHSRRSSDLKAPETGYFSDTRSVVTRLREQILAHAGASPEGTPLAAKSLTSPRQPSGVDQTLSRLTERGKLMRAGRGAYLRSVTGRFGRWAPSVKQAIEALAT